MRFAVWGCGSIGQRHLQNILQLGYTDVVTFDLSPERQAAIAAAFPVAVVETEEALLACGADITVVATPTIFHRDHLLGVLQNTGSHVFVEKPVSHTTQGMAHIVGLAREKRVKVMVACNWRFHPAISQVRHLLQTGVIGPPLSARVEGGSYLPAWHPSEDYRKGYSARQDLGGGCLLDCIHEIDYANWLFGRPSAVAGFFDNVGELDIETEDVAALLVRYESGTIVTVNVDYVQRPAHRSCRIVGRDGTIEWILTDNRVLWYVGGQDEWCEWHVPGEDAVGRSYVTEMEHFIEAVQGNREHMSDLQEGVAAVAVVEAAQESQRHRSIVLL